MTLSEIADSMGITVGEVRSIEGAALRKARRLLARFDVSPEVLFNMQGKDGDGSPVRTRQIQSPGFDYES